MKELLKQLEEAKQQLGISDSILCAKLGLHISDLNAFKSGKCEPWITNIITAFIDKASRNIYPTKLIKVVYKILKTVYSERELGVITSVSGAGKTTAIEQFVIENHNTIHIRVTEVMTAKYLLCVLSKALNAPYIGLTKQQLFENISDLLTREPRLIVIDEAERLEVNQLELLRDIYDQGNIGLCLVGLESLTSLLRHGKTLKENLVQLYSRVGYTKVVNILEAEDVKMIFADKIGKHKVSEAVMHDLAKKLEKHGGLRAVIKLSNLALKTAERNEVAVDDTVVNAAYTKLT